MAERHEAQAENQGADGEYQPRAEAVHQPALGGAEDAALDAGQGEGGGHHRLAPAEVGLQQHHIGAVGLHPQHRRQPLDAAAGADDPPAVEDAPCRTHELIDTLADASPSAK